MSAQLRRSARIQAQAAKPVVEPVVEVPTPKVRKPRVQVPKVKPSVAPKEEVIDYNPDFQYTVDWIQKVRFHLSSLSNDLEDEDHMKILLDMVKEVKWGWGNIHEWIDTVHGWLIHRNTFDFSDLWYSAYGLENDRSAARGTIQTCYETLKMEEEKISTEEHDTAYYFPLQQPTKARKERARKMGAHVTEFIKACRGLGIRFFKDNIDYSATDYIHIIDDSCMNVRNLFYEGSPIIPLTAILTDEKRAMLLSLPNLSEFTDWKGQMIKNKVMKHNETYIPIRFP